MTRRRSPKWRRNPPQRPAQILSAALDVFGESGVPNARLDQIARRAGLAKGTIYLYFQDKEDLFRQAIRHALTGVTGSEPAPAPPSAARHLTQTLTRQWQFLTSPVGLTVSRLVHAEQRQFPELADLYSREVVVRFADELRDVIRRGTDAGEFRELDPALAAHMLIALTLQSAFWSETRSLPALKAKSSETVLHDLTEFYLQSITRSDSAFPQADGA